jgi:hypothetical protein
MTIEKIKEPVHKKSETPNLIENIDPLSLKILTSMVRIQKEKNRNYIKNPEIRKYMESFYNDRYSREWIGLKLKKLERDKVIEPFKVGNKKVRGRYFVPHEIELALDDFFQAQWKLECIESKLMYHYIAVSILNIPEEMFTPNLVAIITGALIKGGFDYHPTISAFEEEKKGKIIGLAFYYPEILSLAEVIMGIQMLDKDSLKLLGIKTNTRYPRLAVDIHVRKNHFLYALAKMISQNTKKDLKTILKVLCSHIGWAFIFLVLSILSKELGNLTVLPTSEKTKKEIISEFELPVK